MDNINKLTIRGNFRKTIHEGRTVRLWEFETLEGSTCVIGVNRLVEVKEGVLYEVIASLHIRRSVSKQGRVILTNGVSLMGIKEVKQKNLEGVGVNE